MGGLRFIVSTLLLGRRLHGDLPFKRCSLHSRTVAVRLCSALKSQMQPLGSSTVARHASSHGEIRTIFFAARTRMIPLPRVKLDGACAVQRMHSFFICTRTVGIACLVQLDTQGLSSRFVCTSF